MKLILSLSEKNEKTQKQAAAFKRWKTVVNINEGDVIAYPKQILCKRFATFTEVKFKDIFFSIAIKLSYLN